ncbi:HSP20 family protein [Prosthecobacter fusiformis]|uniref:HSP20 family protein n=1 Tax=Prosthecobacter fusiformis TaxID=48464 RepID=A0A4V3FFH7_9BACT|nr:Hsp20/alpha crystallin family protein [Prosthecobacter fusiformis]TDU70863.1 HSP20 family protein [Prosthecobacter fusiformis]
MKLARYTPSFDLGRVADFDQWLRHPFAGFPAVGQLLGEFIPGAAGRLATDVYEDKDNYYARFELPGLKKEDVKVEVHDRLLTVSAERREKTDQNEESFVFSRSVSVPEGVRGDAIAAKLEDGILTVTLPKQEERKPKLIQVD